jgi:phage terminase large subunit-like protein
MKIKHYRQTAIKYAQDVIDGTIIAGADIVNACNRFLADLQRDDLEYRDKEPDACITLMEGMFVHRKGEMLDGTPLLGKPLKLEPWQVFIVCNLLGFWYKGTQERRYKEALIMLGRKNGKTSFVAALAFAVSILQRHSGSTVYVVAAALKQAMESFQFMKFSLDYKGISDDFDIKDNAMEHSIKYTFDNNGIPDGTIDIQIMASNPDAQDSFNCNFAIADELAAYKKAAQYNRFKEAMKGFTNKLMIGITTAGDNANSFGYRRMEYAIKVAAGTVQDDDLFSFVARADQDDKGNCDYTDPVQHQKANPNYGVTIRPKDIMNEALQAQNDPQQRKDFLSRSLNIYTSAVKAWFDLDEFKASDQRYHWELEDLAKLGIDWFGGADLSRMYDLTAAALVGHYSDKGQDVDIIITHAFTPIAQATRKADEDNIPLFGWADDGWLTLCNSPTVNISDVVNWFKRMREIGFRIKRVGHDRKFAGEEYFPAMKTAGFTVIDQPQYFYLKSQGFRHIEKAAKDGRLYYLHSQAYEYCVANVAAIEKTDDAVQYEKVMPELRIDLFDASVFATIQMVSQEEKAKKGRAWWGE